MWLFQSTIEPFLIALNKELGYTLNIDKLKDFLEWIDNNDDQRRTWIFENRFFTITRCFSSSKTAR